MKCPICQTVFEPKRVDAKTCGKDSCRKKLQRLSKAEGGVKIGVPEKNTEAKTKTPLKAPTKPTVSKHPSIKPPKPDYMTDYDYSRWDGVECKWGPCLDKNCKWRNRD